MENASNTKTLEMYMGSVLLVADVEDEKYYKAFSTFLAWIRPTWCLKLYLAR